MTETPSILLIFDISALLASNTREWQEFSQIGECQVPESVWEEIRFLCNRAPEPELEQISREFVRFYPRSGWNLTKVNASHPSLQAAPGEELSKQARLTLSVAECVYGMGRENPQRLVVLITNSQPLTQKVQSLTLPNICGITMANLKQWSRSKHEPMSVSQQVKDMRAMARSQGMSGVVRSTSPTPTNKVASAGAAKSMRRSTTPAKSTPAKSTPAKSKSAIRSSRSNPLPKLLTSLSGFLVLAIVGFAIWRFGPMILEKAGLRPLPGTQQSSPSPKSR